MPRPHATNYKDYVRKRTEQLIHEGYEADQAYAIANSEARKMFLGHGSEEEVNPYFRRVPDMYLFATVDQAERVAEKVRKKYGDIVVLSGRQVEITGVSRQNVEDIIEAEGAKVVMHSAREESPTRDPWVVSVKTTEPDKVQRLAGIRGEVRHLEKGGSRVLFTFYDDELSRSLASRLTRAGYIVTWGPEKAVAAEEESAPTVVGLESSLSKAERTKLEREVWKKTPADDRALIRGEKSVLVDSDTKGGGRFTTTYPLSKVSDAKLRELLHGQQSHAAEAPFTAPERNPKDVDAGKKYGTAKDARAVYDMLHEQLNKESQEVFLVLPLDLHGDLLCPPVEVARGQRDRVSVDPSDVLRSVIETNASGFIVIHNHPSGHSKPSDADRDLTKRLRKAATPFEPVVLVDHVIIGRREYYSISEDRHYKVK